MLPRRSSTISQRRSSILKPPKSRQPFQDLDFNSSSPEISPESTKKRRVSFAEKKHVKEFCDHKEQGTIWDNTYEEADQNVSKSTDITNENSGCIDTNIKYTENVGAGFNFLDNNRGPKNSETCIIMDPNRVENFSKQILCNAEVDLELTDVIPCSQTTSNNLMSKTIFCQDADLEITEVIGGIESTVSLKSMTSSREIKDSLLKNIENTKLFDNNKEEMNFRQVINDRIIQTPTTAIVAPNQGEEKTNSFIENQTIIFEDSIMELTLTTSHTESGLDPDKHMETNVSQNFGNNVRCEKIDLNRHQTVIDGKAPQASNKTILFNDLGCDMTEAVNTIMHQVSETTLLNKQLAVELEKPKNSRVGAPYVNKTILFNDAGCDMTEAVSTVMHRVSETNLVQDQHAVELQKPKNNSVEGSPSSNKTILFNDLGCDLTEAINTIGHKMPEVSLAKKKVQKFSEPDINCKNNLSNGSDPTSAVSDTPCNKTILFNDFGCEMTEAIVTLKTCPVPGSNDGETKEAEQIVPQQVLSTDALTYVQMEMEPGESQRDSLSSELLNIESSPEPIPEANNQTEVYNDSAIEFTAAIARGDNMIQENCTLERNQIPILDNSNVDITEDVSAIRHKLNSRSNLEEEDNLLSTEIKYDNVQNDKKRKSSDSEAEIDCGKSTNSTISKSAGHDLVQRLVLEEFSHSTNDNLSNTFAPGCKRLKIADVHAGEDNLFSVNGSPTVQSEPLENITNRTLSTAPEDNLLSTEIKYDNVQNDKKRKSSDSEATQDVPDMQIQVSTGMDITKDCCTSLAQEPNDDMHEDVAVVTDLNYCKNQERLTITGKKEMKAKESSKIPEGDVCEEESSFVESTLVHLNSDLDSESLELLRVHVKQQQSLVKESNNVRNSLEPNTCLDNNDDCCFVMFSEELEKYAKSDDCIWSIRSIDQEKVLINFISKSLVVVIRFAATEEITTPRIITDIQIISLLADSLDDDISIVHNILLKKLDPEHLKGFHRTTQDVLPLLELISHRVKLTLDFMYEFDKLQDLHLINRSGSRISFRLHSYKVQLVIKITIDLERFEDIGPNDVEVECLLGNIRKKDVKQLITSVKKDHRFLTNYISDVKEYIALVGEK